MKKNKNIKQEKVLPLEKSNSVFNATPLYWLVFILAFALYINTIGNDYALDDIAVIQQNKFTQQGIAGIPKMLTTFYWQGYWDQNAGLYRPLSLITFAVEYQFFKANPQVSHFINVLLYALTAMLLFHVLKKIFTSFNIILPLIIVLIFVAHPTHTEIVANIKSRDELLSFLFFLLSANYLVNYLNYNNNKALLISLGCYFLSLLSKEGSLVFVGIFPLIIYFHTKKSTVEIIKLSSYFLIIAIVFIGIHQYVIAHSPPRHPYSYHDNSLVAAKTISERLATAVYMFGNYYKLLIFPHPLSYDYSYSQFPIKSWFNLQVLLVLCITGYLIYYAIKNIKQKSYISFGIFFFFISISMVSNIFMLIGTSFADRLLYAPSLGFAIVLGILLLKALKLNDKQQNYSSVNHLLDQNKKLVLVVGLLVIIGSAKTISRNVDWKDNFTLFSADVKASTRSSRTHYNYGTELMFQKAFPEKDTLKKRLILNEVITELEIAANIDSIDPGIYLNLSTAYYQQKNYVKAIDRAYLAAKYNPNDGKPYSTMGNSYYKLGNVDKAIEYFQLSIDRKFGEQEAYNTMGACYFSKKEYSKAAEAFVKSIAFNPNDITALNNLGSVYGLTGEYQKSAEVFRKSYALDSNNVQTCYYLALTYQGLKDANNANYFQKRYETLKNGK